MLNFTNSSMIQIIDILQTQLHTFKAKEIIEFEVLNPDLCSSTYGGNSITLDNQEYIYRGYKSWIDLAQQLHCKMLTPTIITKNTLLIRFELLNPDDSFHKQISDKEEKYGSCSIFNEIHKNEEASFIYYYRQALKNVKVSSRTRILNLGVNSGDEFVAITQMV